MKRSPVETLGWAVLGLLLLATLVSAALFDRAKLPLLGDEATYAMQAASLARDFDLAYSREDYDRFVATWGVKPEGLILQSREGSERLVYAKPPLYALATAPFVRFAPVRGGPIANALMLAAAALLAARTLRTRLGGAAPLWVAVFLFGSVAFAYVFWGEADLLLLAAVAAGFALVYGGDRTAAAPASVYQGEETESARPVFLRWLGAGALLAVAVAYRPFYLALFLPALLAARSLPIEHRRRGLAGLALGAVLLLGLSAGLQRASGGDWTGYGGKRQGLYARAEYPAVDFPAERWSARVERQGNASWLQREAVRPELNPRLAGWNVLYFLAGRNVGVLPYFLPLLLGLLAYRGDRGRWAILLAVAVAALAFLLLRPFNFFGGGPLGNRYFLPLYPALWFLAARPARPARAIWAVLVTALAGLFLWPLWLHPTAYPVTDAGDYRHVSSAARRFLPYETTQNAVPGEQAVAGGGLWVRLLDHNAWPTPSGQRFRMVGNATAEILVGSPQPLDSLFIELDRRAPTKLVVGEEELRPLMLGADGSVAFQIPLHGERAVHPLWWSPYDYHFYKLILRLPGGPASPVGFRLEPPRDLIQRSGE
jgi:hypothetical protein